MILTYLFMLKKHEDQTPNFVHKEQLKTARFAL